MAMSYEEAIGVGRVISSAQLAMILHMDAWPPDRRRDYNIEELIWKGLIRQDHDSFAGYTLTDRGEAVRDARRLKDLSDMALLHTFSRTDGESLFATRVLREIEDRRLDV